MAGVTSRQGVVFVDSAGGGGDALEQVDREESTHYGTLQAPGSPVSSSGVESEGSYAEVYSDDSYHSDGDEIAEIWDPYRKLYTIVTHLVNISSTRAAGDA